MSATLCIVTGSSRGIGAATARELVDRGVEVIGVARSAPTERLGKLYRHLPCDLSDLELVRESFAAIAGELEGRERVGLVNNAARLDLSSIRSARLDDLREAVLVNLAVPIWLHGFVLRHAPQEAAVRLVDLSSGAAGNPYPGWASYCSTKAGLEMAGRVLAVEVEESPALAGRDIRIVSYAPGVVDTGMQEQLRAARESEFPRRERFVALHERGELVPAARPAREIADLLFDDDLPVHSRWRYPRGR